MSSATPSEPSRFTVTFAGPDHGEHGGFWSEYDKLAGDFDNEMIEALNSNLDSLLIFAGLFSSVNSSALFYSINGLSAGTTDQTNALLQTLIIQSVQVAKGNTTLPNTGPSLFVPPGPAIWTNTFFAASLVTSLLAAFGAVLAKQWLLHYKQTGQIGEVEIQCRKRQQKYAGARRYNLRTVVEILPTLLQFSLLAFFIGLINCFWSLQRLIAAVITVLTGLGFLAYTISIIIAVRNLDCPFQTHVTQIVRGLVAYFTKHHMESPVETKTKTKPYISPDSDRDSDLGLPSFQAGVEQVNGEPGRLAAVIRRVRLTVSGVKGMKAARARYVQITEDRSGIGPGIRMALRTVGDLRSEDELRVGTRTVKEAELHRDCVVWTLEVSDKKKSLLEAARSIPSFRTVEACHAMLHHPLTSASTAATATNASTATVTTTKAFNRLIGQLHASLLDAKAGRHTKSGPWTDAVLFGRALIHIFLPLDYSAAERSNTWTALSKSWPSERLSHFPEFAELSLIALSILPTLSMDNPEHDLSKIPSRSIPLYIGCLVTSATLSQARTAVVRSLIAACLKAEEVPIEHVLVCAWALKVLAGRPAGGRAPGGTPCNGFWGAYRSDVDVASYINSTINVLNLNSINECDCAFLRVVSTLLAQVTKPSTQYSSFKRRDSKVDLLLAVKPIVQAEEPSSLRTEAVRIMAVLARRPELHFCGTGEFRTVADTIFAQICGNTDADLVTSPAVDFLTATSDFALRPELDSMESQSFRPSTSAWLRSIVYLATKGAQKEPIREKKGDGTLRPSFALVALQWAIECPEMTKFWEAETICQVLSCYGTLFSSDAVESSRTVGDLMLPLLETPMCRALTINRGLLHKYPQALNALLDWMKAQIEDLWIRGLVVVHHWKEEWLEHDEEEVHTLFQSAGLAEAVIAPWRQGTSTKLDVYNERNGILAILAPKSSWRDGLVEAFTQVVIKDRGWGGWRQAYKSMERYMIWRMAVVIQKQPQPHPELSPMYFVVHLMGMGDEKPEGEIIKDRGWFRAYPQIAGLLSFALQEPQPTRDAALETIQRKSAFWFGHEEADLHQIFIDQGMVQALVRSLYIESHIEEDSRRRDVILRTLFRSKTWVDSFYQSVILEENGAVGARGSAEIERLDIGLRARAVLDLQRLLVGSTGQEAGVTPSWVSDEALRIVIDYVERRKWDLKEIERSACWSYAIAVMEARGLEFSPSLKQGPGGGSDSGRTEPIKITFRCERGCCRWTVGKPGATSLASLGLSPAPQVDRKCTRRIVLD
ncbi:hypothetical protein FRB98_004136 [Tulasnella sp. 332]|nr:hypothetical protein FRB98_004136 [Tulasnella sp. 332]